MSGAIDTGPVGKSRRSTEIDLNIAPIIDCLVVLIAFMLASAAYLSIGILDAGVAATGPTSEEKPPSVNIEVQISRNQNIRVAIKGKTNREIDIKAGQDQQIDLQSFSKEMAQLAQSFPDVKALTLSADDAVEYKDIILTMNEARKHHPAVLLGGF